MVSIGSDTTHLGWEAIVTGLRAAEEAFPDWHVRIDRTVADGAVVVVEWEARGTNTGPFHGEPATGKAFRRRGCSVAEIAGGKIVRYRDYFDGATLFSQLGLVHLLG